MGLNHLNLTVPHVPRTREFFETYFGFRTLLRRADDTLAVLVDGSRFVLSLNNFGKAGSVGYPSGFHIGFLQDSREAVDEVHRRLVDGGFGPNPPKEFHGAWTFYIDAPGGFTVEVLHQPVNEHARDFIQS